MKGRDRGIANDTHDNALAAIFRATKVIRKAVRAIHVARTGTGIGAGAGTANTSAVPSVNGRFPRDTSGVIVLNHTLSCTPRPSIGSRAQGTEPRTVQRFRQNQRSRRRDGTTGPQPNHGGEVEPEKAVLMPRFTTTTIMQRPHLMPKWSNEFGSGQRAGTSTYPQ